MRGIFFIEPEDEEFKHTMKNARRMLEIPMPAAMPCKTLANCFGENCRSVAKRKTKEACIVDADESMRIRLDRVPQRYHEDLGMISLSVDPFFECRQLCLNSHGVLKVRTGHESVNQSQPCWALPHQAKGSNTETRSKL